MGFIVNKISTPDLVRELLERLQSRGTGVIEECEHSFETLHQKLSDHFYGEEDDF